MTETKNQISQSELAYRKLREAITFGELQPGERLVETAICKEYNLGRTPLREAIRRLQNDGYIDVVPNKGVTVKKLSLDDVANIWSIIALMEGYATELAVGKLNAEDVDALADYHEKMSGLTGSEEASGYVELNVAFHRLLTHGCENDYLIKTIEEFRAKIYRYRFLTVFNFGNQEQLNNDHQAIMDAIINNDPPYAIGQIVRRHIERIRDISLELLTKGDPRGVLVA